MAKMTNFGTVLKYNPNHDRLGRFSTGTTANALNKRLVDYKPDRSLSNPAEIRQISELLQGAKYTSYGDMPFIKQLHNTMGVVDPFKVPVPDYIAARDKVFRDVPETQVSLKNLVVTQRFVNKARVQQAVKDTTTGGKTPIQAVLYQNQYYVINGHHRLARAAVLKETTISAKVLNMDSIRKFELVFKYNPNHDKLGRFATVNKIAGNLPPNGYGYKTAEELVNSALPKIEYRAAFLKAIAAQNFKVPDTKSQYSKNGDGTGGYTTERLKLHKKIIDKLLGGNLENLKPDYGVKPTLIILGGRGGSGKSNFDKDVNPNVGVYDRTKFLTLDADVIKSLIPDYHPENAFRVHEESSDILLKAARKARQNNLNVVLDVTLKSRGEKWLRTFKGYRAEAYYMHRPADLAAKSAIDRWNKPSTRIDINGVVHQYKKGRLVAPAIILGNKNNESNFDYLIPKVSKWAVWDNSNPANGQFKIYASGENSN